MPRQHRDAAAAAGAGGQRTGRIAAGSASVVPPVRPHINAEAMLAGYSLAWMAPRDGFHAANGLAFRHGCAVRAEPRGRPAPAVCPR